MWYLIKYTFLITLGIIWTILITFIGLIICIGAPISVFKFYPFYPLEKKEEYVKYYLDFNDHDWFFPVFNSKKIPYRQSTGGSYNIYMFKNHYHYIWGL